MDQLNKFGKVASEARKRKFVASRIMNVNFQLWLLVDQ